MSYTAVVQEFMMLRISTSLCDIQLVSPSAACISFLILSPRHYLLSITRNHMQGLVTCQLGSISPSLRALSFICKVALDSSLSALLV